MTRKRPTCADCGERSSDWNRLYPVAPDDEIQVCTGCRFRNYDGCRRCGRVFRLEDMRQAWCRWCRSVYDRDRWARQRAARGLS
jgi:hypothetical protein